MDNLHIIVLAAGKGTRMFSALPKTLIPLAGKPILHHVLDVAQGLDPTAIHVVYGDRGEQVQTACDQYPIHWVHQSEQLGTGHAVMQALPEIPDDSTTLVLYGDVPLVTQETLTQLIKPLIQSQGLALLTTVMDNPTGYGRILRDRNDKVTAVVEQKDADEEQLHVREVNTGLIAANTSLLKKLLEKLDNDNMQHEYYLTDVIAKAVGSGLPIFDLCSFNSHETVGVNTGMDLVIAETNLRWMNNIRLAQSGVRLSDLARVDVRGELTCGQDVTIDVNTIFKGRVHLDDGVVIGPNCVIDSSTIGARTHIKSNCVIEHAVMGSDCEVGPFCYLRKQNTLADNVKLGTFVELKETDMATGSKAKHLSYLGNATIGENTNIGAGTITANYDGQTKHPTVVEKNSFVGAHTTFVAPVVIGEGATLGAGSVITKDAPAHQLTLARSRQQVIKDWKK